MNIYRYKDYAIWHTLAEADGRTNCYKMREYPSHDSLKQSVELEPQQRYRRLMSVLSLIFSWNKVNTAHV